MIGVTIIFVIVIIGIAISIFDVNLDDNNDLNKIPYSQAEMFFGIRNNSVIWLETEALSQPFLVTEFVSVFGVKGRKLHPITGPGNWEFNPLNLESTRNHWSELRLSLSHMKGFKWGVRVMDRELNTLYTGVCSSWFMGYHTTLTCKNFPFALPYDLENGRIVR